MLAGPPCNTWSRVRIVAGGPGLVRSAARLWGDIALTRRDADRVALANRLLGVTFILFAELALAGGSAVVERPEVFWGEGLPSIWRLPLVRHLLLLREVSWISLDQCQFGLDEAKGPTRVLVLRLPTLLGALDAVPGGRFCSHRGHVPLRGREAGGLWRTARKRAYREPLCRVFAEAFVRELQGVVAGDSGGVPDYRLLPATLQPFLGVPIESEVADCRYADLNGADLRRRAPLRKARKVLALAELMDSDPWLSRVTAASLHDSSVTVSS